MASASIQNAPRNGATETAPIDSATLITSARREEPQTRTHQAASSEDGELVKLPMANSTPMVAAEKPSP